MLFKPPTWRSPYTVAALCRAGVQVSSLLGMLVAVSKLPPEVFGAFSVAWVTTVIANTLLYAGSYEYLLRVKDLEEVQDSVFWLLVAQGAVGSLVLFGGAMLAGADGNTMSRTCFMAMIPIPLCAAWGAWCDGLLTRQGHAATVGSAIFVAELAGATAMAGALYLELGFVALIIWRLVSTAMALVGLVAFTDRLPRLRCTRAALYAAMRAALPLQGTTLLNSLSNYAADLLLAWRFSPAASASYRASARVAVTGSDVFTQPLRSMTWAALGEREREGDRAGMRRVYLEQLRMLSFFAWPTLVGLSVFSGRLFATISKADWSEAGRLLTWLAIGRAANLLFFFLGPVLVCTGRSAAYVRLQTVITAASLGLLATFTLRGSLAVAICDMCLQIVIGGYATWQISRALEARVLDIVAAITPACFAALVCVTAGELCHRVVVAPPAVRLGISIAVMGATLLACFVLAGRRLAIRLPGSAQPEAE